MEPAHRGPSPSPVHPPSLRSRPGTGRRPGRGPGPAVAAVVAVLAVAGCGSPGDPAVAAPSAAPPASAPAAAPPVDPNAPEPITQGDIPDNQVYVPFTPPGSGLTIAVPQGWARSADGEATVFTDKFNSVRLAVRPHPRMPDTAQVKAVDVPLLQQSTPGFQLVDVSSVTRKAGTTVLVRYQATSAPDPVTLRSVTTAVERYVFWHAGQEAELTLSGPKGADNVDPWRTITDSVRWS
jgi:hypothetical protein